MTTTWINKDKFKDENFSSIKEGFIDISLNINPLEQFLKANPLKSIFDSEPVNSRNLKEPFTQIDSALKPLDYDEKEADDNIVNNLNNTVARNMNKQKLTRGQIEQDDKTINSIIISLFSIFIGLYVSYNWYFTMTEGYKKRFAFYEKFEFTNYLYFFTEYFYKIIEFFDKSITKYIPEDLVSKIKKSWFKERSIFVLIFIISYFSVKFIIRVIKRGYNILNKYIQTGKIDFFKLIYDPKNNNILVIVLFIGFVIFGLIDSVASVGKKVLGVQDEISVNPSDKFKDALTQFKIAHPLSYLIIFLIRISLIYSPTVSFASSLILVLYIFYSLIGIPYYTSQDDEGKNEIFKNDNMTLIEMFRRIHAYMNINHVVFEDRDDDDLFTRVKNFFEIYVFRLLFNFSPYIILFSSLFSVIPSILNLHSSQFKWTGIGIISVLSIAIFKFMVDETPILYINIQKFKNMVSNLADTFDVDDATDADTNATDTNATDTNATDTNATDTNATDTNANATENS
jgi:hypothetical protein